MMPYGGIYGEKPGAEAERRAAHDGLVAALTRDLLSARAKFDSVQEHVAYLLERYDITPKT